MATQHSTQKQKTITIMCNQPGGAVVRVSPSTTRVAMELDEMDDPDRKEFLQLLRQLKTAGKLPEFLATRRAHLADHTS